jgi:integrase
MNAQGRRRGRPLRQHHAAAPDAADAGQVVRLSPASGRKHMAALRGVLRYAWELGYFSYDDYARAVNVKPIVGDPVAADAGRSLTPGELLALIQVAAADPHPDGARDVAIFSLGYGLGLRRSDLITLDLDDYDDADATLTFRGKGNKQTALPVEGGARFALEQWIAIRGNEPGPMFYRVRAFGHVVRKRMTTQAIYDIVRRRAREANVQPFSPHDLRRTFAGDMLDLGVDLATLQQLMRHADPRTTAGYDRRPGRVRREAVRRLHIPSVPLARKGA